MISQAIYGVERGWLPDSIIRWGIRRLCHQRLRQEFAFDCERQSVRYNEFLNVLNSSKIAIATAKANQQHYEIPAEFYHYVLGSNLKYSACLWSADIHTLNQAESAMLQVYCERAELEDGQSILELGCGWGSLTLFLAAKYPNSKITAVSNSHSQRAYVQQQAQSRGLRNLEIITQDINDFVSEHEFDRIVSIEMFEHVRNYSRLFLSMADWLVPDGKAFIHVFCHRYLMYPFEEHGAANWMGRYFFSGGQMPSADTFLNFQQHLHLEQRWLLNGRHYTKTANAWLANMDLNKAAIKAVFEKVYEPELVSIWRQRWRIFFMACAELFGYAEGNQWMIGHYRFKKR